MKRIVEVIKVGFDDAPTFFKNSLLKPSGPRDLSRGSNLMILSISVWLKGVTRELRSIDGWIKESREKSICSKLVEPNLSLKSYQIKSALVA